MTVFPLSAGDGTGRRSTPRQDPSLRQRGPAPTRGQVLPRRHPPRCCRPPRARRTPRLCRPPHHCRPPRCRHPPRRRRPVLLDDPSSSTAGPPRRPVLLDGPSSSASAHAPRRPVFLGDPSSSTSGPSSFGGPSSSASAGRPSSCTSSLDASLCVGSGGEGGRTRCPRLTRAMWSGSPNNVGFTKRLHRAPCPRRARYLRTAS